jgi:hypothetical protein
LKNQDLIGLSEYVHSSSSNKSSKSIKKSRYKVKVNHIIKAKSKDKNNKFETKTELYKGKDDKNKSKISYNKNKSLIKEDNQFLDDLIPDEFKEENELNVFSPNYSKKEILCLSEDKNKSKRLEKYRKQFLESSSSHLAKKVNHLELFDNLYKNYKSKHYEDEDEKMNKYYDEIYNKYGKENEKINPESLVDVKIFGFDFKIPLKIQRNYYKKFMANVRFQNIKRRDERNINQRLSYLLDKYSLQKLNEKNNKILKQRKSKISNMGIKKYFRQNTNFNGGTQKNKWDQIQSLHIRPKLQKLKIMKKLKWILKKKCKRKKQDYY